MQVRCADEVVDGVRDVPAGAVEEVEWAEKVEGAGFLDWWLRHADCARVEIGGEGKEAVHVGDKKVLYLCLGVGRGIDLYR